LAQTKKKNSRTDSPSFQAPIFAFFWKFSYTKFFSRFPDFFHVILLKIWGSFSNLGGELFLWRSNKKARGRKIGEASRQEGIPLSSLSSPPPYYMEKKNPCHVTKKNTWLPEDSDN
jgi:hypothetical protein